MDNKLIPNSRPTLGIEEERAAATVIRKGNLSQGEEVEKFERSFAAYVGVKYGIAVNTGLSALHLALLALGKPNHNEIILPSYVCEGLLDTVAYVAAKPVVVDVNLNDGNMLPESLKKKVTKRTKAIILPHIFGVPAPVDEILQFGVPVIEDCAHSAGAIFKNKKIGSFGQISIFSFYATKMLTTGEGGMILTNDKKISDTVRDLRDYTKKEHFKIRYNYKMTDIAAAIGNVQLAKLEGFIKRRIEIASIYDNNLRDIDGITIPPVTNCANEKKVFYRYMLRARNKSRDSILEKLRHKKILCGVGVANPLHRILRLPVENFRNTEDWVINGISIPIYPTLTNDEVARVCNALKKSFRRR
jgi:perosamine synthetase